jgi:hypothetical protein
MQEHENLYIQYDKERNGSKRQELLSSLLKEFDAVGEGSAYPGQAAGWIFTFDHR